MRIIPLLLVAALPLAGFGCEQSRGTDPRKPIEYSLSPTTTPYIVPGGTFDPISDSIERMEYYFAPVPEAKILLYKFNPAEKQLLFHHGETPISLNEWQTVLPDAELLVNGVFFHEDHLPSGMFIQNGVSVGDRTFDTNLSGFIQLDPGPKILDTRSEPISEEVQNGAQSFPFFLIDGEPAIEQDSGQVARRTFVGTDTDGMWYVGNVPNMHVSLFQLMRHLDAMPIAWDNVINLDGGPSTGITVATDEFSEHIESYTAVPNVLSISPR